MNHHVFNQLRGNLCDLPGQDCQGAASENVIHIWLNHPPYNRDGGLELPRCWMAALKVVEGTNEVSAPVWC